VDEITQLTKEAFEPKLGRPMPDEEAAEFAMHLRRLAAFLIDCSKDEALMDRLGLREKAELPRAELRVADSTTQADGNPPGAHLPALAGPPTAPPAISHLIAIRPLRRQSGPPPRSLKLN